MSIKRILLATLPLSLLLAACTSSGSGASTGAVRTIAVTMTDALRFEPDEIAVAMGETVRFEITNEGQAVHEFLIGSEADQARFEEAMAEEGGGHETSAGVSVDPGHTATFEYTFSERGSDVLAGCHEPGHYDGGMVATIVVTD